MTKPMGKAPTLIWMGLSMRETGKKTNSMDLEWRLGQMAQDTRDITSTEKSMGEVNSIGLIEVRMMVIFMIIIFMEGVSTPGVMEVSMMENGRKTRWMEKASLLGSTIEDTKASTEMIRRKVMESSNGETVAAIKASG